MKEVFTHSLDLAISLIDTTTGRHVGETDTEFIFDDVLRPKPVFRGSGTFILMGYGKENFHMQIKLKGYESVEIDVDYEKLDERLPLLNVFLIPAISPLLNDNVCLLEGNVPGISEISLVRMADVRAHTDTYNAKKKLLTVFERGNRLNMEGSPFGIISPTKESFEMFEISDQKAENQVELKEPLMGEFIRNASIARGIHGRVDADGNFRIAIRKDGADLRCILRYVVNGETKFMKVDFNKLDELGDL